MVDDLDDRLSRRLETTQAESTEDESQPSVDSTTSDTARSARNSQNAQNIKKEWNVRSFYLDDDLDDDLTTAFKRLDLALSEADSGIDLKKTRHFYPLVVELGLERLEEMEVTDITERLDIPDSV